MKNLGTSSEQPNKKAAIYARVSTMTQVHKGLGLEGQIELCKRICKLKKYEIYNIYVDSGISGTVEGHEREEFNKLLRDAEDKKFQTVIFYKIDRIGRKMSVIIKIMEKLLELNIKPIFVEDNIDTTTDQGMLMFNILASVSDHELRIIKSRLKNGYNAKKNKCGDIGGILPYGYHKINGVVDINAKEKEIITHIFNMIDKGMSYNRISQILNTNNIETPSGKGKWYAETVKRIDKNKHKYIGIELINNNQNNIYWPKILN
jgi:site-specific DNA recombinase